MNSARIRLTRSRLFALKAIHEAGARGVPMVLARWPELFCDAGFAERFTDPTRIWSDRVRITEHGSRIAAALCPRGDSNDINDNTIHRQVRRSRDARSGRRKAG